MNVHGSTNSQEPRNKNDPNVCQQLNESTKCIYIHTNTLSTDTGYKVDEP